MNKTIFLFWIFISFPLLSFANDHELPPISTAIQASDLDSLYENGKAIHKYLDDMLIGKQQAGDIDWVLQNYELNLRLGAIPGTYTAKDSHRLTVEQLNESLSRIGILSRQYRVLSLTNYETDHALNFIRIGFLHAILLMKLNSLRDREAYTQILNAFKRDFMLGHSSGAADAKRSILVLDLLIAYSNGLPIDLFEQLSNNCMVNAFKIVDPEQKKILQELALNLALFGVKKGTAPKVMFSISESQFRLGLAARALEIAENNKFQYSHLKDVLEVYRATALANGHVRQAKEAYFKEIRIGGLMEKPLIAVLLILSLWGVWLLAFGAVFSVGYRKWRAGRAHACTDYGKSFCPLRFLKVIGQIVVETVKEFFYCIYKSEVRKNYTVEIALLTFSLSWILNDLSNDLQILLAKSGF